MLPVIGPGALLNGSMAKRLVIAFDFVDEEGNSLIDGQFNNLVTPLAVNEISPMDVTDMWMFICSVANSFQRAPSIRHLFPQTPYGISMEPGSIVTDKSHRIFFETAHGHTPLVHLPKDD